MHSTDQGQLSMLSQIQGTEAHFSLKVQALEVDSVWQEDSSLGLYHVLWFPKGKGQFQVDFKEWRIQNGGLLFLTPGQVLSMSASTCSEVYRLSFDQAFYCVETHGKEIACNGRFFNNVHDSAVIALDAEGHSRVQRLMDDIQRELQQPGAAHRSMLESYLRILLIQALRWWGHQHQQAEEESDSTPQLAQSFITLVEQQFRKVHTVSEYAAQLFVAPKTLTKRLQQMGYPPPTEMIQQRILLQAKRDLLFSDLPIKEIAFQLGYEDAAYFSRVFTKWEGLSPNGFRRMG